MQIDPRIYCLVRKWGKKIKNKFTMPGIAQWEPRTKTKPSNHQSQNNFDNINKYHLL